MSLICLSPRTLTSDEPMGRTADGLDGGADSLTFEVGPESMMGNAGGGETSTVLEGLSERASLLDADGATKGAGCGGAKKNR
jgi:hypothetical protein